MLRAITALVGCSNSPAKIGLILSPSCSEVPALATTMSPSLSPWRISTLSSDNRPTDDAPHLDGAVAHHPHAGALDPVVDRVARDRDAAASPGVDGGAGEHADPQRRIARRPPDAHFAELGFLIDVGSDEADPADPLGAAGNRNARDLAGLELRHVDARNFGLELDLVVDQDLKQRLGLRRRHFPDPRGALR